MKRILRVSLLILVLFFTNTIYSEKQDIFSIKNIMSTEEFQKCGLNKVSPTELKSLNNWLSKTMIALFSLGGNCVEHSIKFVEDPIIGLDDGSIWETYDSISYSWSSYDSVIIYDDKMINLDEEEIVEVISISQSEIIKPFSKKSLVGGNYIGIGGGHWIKKIESGGKIIILEDHSVWEISAMDRIYSVLWLPTTSITVVLSDYPILDYKYLLINTDDGEKALAKYLSK